MYFTYFCAIILFCLDCNNNIEAFILTEISPHLSSYFWKKIKSTYKVSWSVCIELNFSQKLSEKQKKFRRHGSFIFIQTIQTEWENFMVVLPLKRDHTRTHIFSIMTAPGVSCCPVELFQKQRQYRCRAISWLIHPNIQ